MAELLQTLHVFELGIEVEGLILVETKTTIGALVAPDRPWGAPEL